MSRKNTSEKTEGFTPHDFAIKQMLGTGKFSNVFKAINKETDFTVALKLMAKIVIENSKIYRQVQRQIQIQHRLKHPNICQLFAYFQDENNLYIVLEYCANGSLASIIKDKHQKLEEKRIAKIVLQLFQALAYMHERNVMHRDLKLQNILLDQNDNIKISDFGCCRHHALSRDTFCGTLEYISPEMLNKEKYNHSIDIYCVGVILYQLFYFVSPFVGNNKEETFNNINEGKFTFKDQIRQISKQAKDLIILLLQKDPTKRPKAKDILNHKFIQKYSTSSINRPQQNNQMLSRQELVVGLQNVQQNAGNIQQNSFSLRLYPDLQK